MAIPIIEDWTDNTGLLNYVAVQTLTKPAGVVVGDLLVIIVTTDSSSNSAQFSDNVAGWTFHGHAGDKRTDCHFGVYSRVADGTEGATQTTTSLGAAYWTGYYLRISGAVSVDQFVSAKIVAGSVDVPAVTGDANTLVLFGTAFDGGDGLPFAVSGAGFAKKSELQTTTAASGSSSCYGSAVGGSGIVTITASMLDGFAAFQMAITGTAGGGATVIEADGSASGTSTATGQTATVVASTGAATGSATATGLTSMILTSEGSASGIATATGQTGSVVYLDAVGTASGQAVASALTQTVQEFTATSAGLSTVFGTLQAILSSVGSSMGNSTAIGRMPVIGGWSATPSESATSATVVNGRFGAKIHRG